MTLDEIAIKHGTDKATQFPNGPHFYTPHYAKFFDPIRLGNLKVLEIGVGGGESIRTWLEYFPNASVFGVDVAQGSHAWNTKGSGEPRYTFVNGDQADPTFWKCFAADYGVDWDIVIDDGGHRSNGVITSFDGLWPVVKSGGLYCIEDLSVSYIPGELYLPPGWKNHMDFIKDRLDDINLKAEIEFLYFSKDLAIFRKK